MAIESKSFDFELVGTNVDFLRIYENGRGRRFSVLPPELASQWLLRAWGRFCKSDSPSWFNQFRLGSDRFLLEYKRNRVGMFLQLSVIRKGQRSFVIFPAGWNGGGWKKNFDAMSEIISPLSKGPGRVRAESSSQGAVGLNASLPSPPLGRCPKCGFSGEPISFLRTLGQGVSSEQLRFASTGAEDPSSGKGKQVNRPTPSYVGSGVFYRRKCADEGVQRRSGKERVTSKFPPLTFCL